MAQRGLGPQGFAAVRSAAQIHERINQAPLRNPSAITINDPGEEDNVPDDWYQFASSRVAEAGYDAAHQRLYVRWVKPGPGYIYEGVPSNIWRNMRRSGSAGKFVNRVLNGFEYHSANF